MSWKEEKRVRKGEQARDGVELIMLILSDGVEVRRR